jgi:hypothetical protein
MSARLNNPSVASFLFLLVSSLVFCSDCLGQQPFMTDDADVTQGVTFHFEFINEFDVLQRSLFPNLKQNTADFELNYGLFEGVGPEGRQADYDALGCRGHQSSRCEIQEADQVTREQ